VKLAPHPAWRRLFANGAAPALTVERLTQAGLKLERLASKSPLPQWLFAPSLETLLRSIDLSGIESKALAIAHNRAANEMTRAAVLRRVREHVEWPRNDIGVAAAAAPEQPSRPSARDVGEIAAILRRYGSEAVVEPSGSLKIAPAAVATAAGRSRSSAPLTITRAEAAASLLKRFVRAGDPAIAHSTFTSGPAGATASDLSERSAESTDAGARQPHRSPTAGTSQIQRGDAIARIIRTLADLRSAAAGSGRRRVRGRLSRQWRADSAPIAEDASEFSASEQSGLRGLAARSSRALDSGRGFTDHRPSWIEEAPGAAADSVSTGEGPRGLAARVSRRAARSLSVEGARSAPDLEDFADRLDQLLRREARRNGIDLEEIDR
jgi:hypothetical protein